MNKPLVAMVSGGVVFGLSLIFGIVGMTESLSQNARGDYRKWMEPLPDSTKISDMAIPGTHDTAALYGLADLAGQCQSLPLKQQLILGARFLDIRLKESSDSLRAVHGIVDEKCSFKDIVYTMETFVTENPKEVLFVSIKEEADPESSSLSFDACLKTYIKEASPWYLERTMPETLGAARGKIVLLSRYPGSTMGVDLYSGWNDNATFTMGDFHVQDEYKVQDIEAKKQAIEACYAESSAPYKINFLSGYKTSGFPPSYAPSVAKVINAWAPSVFSSANLKGFTVLDFYTTELAKSFFEASL